MTPEELRRIGDRIARAHFPAPAPRQPELVILPVDPYHLHAYWHLGDSPPPEEPEKWVLRVFWRPDDSVDLAATRLWFDRVITEPRGHLEVRVPVDDSAYQAAAGVRDGNHRLTFLAVSNRIRVPRARMAPSRQAVVEAGLERRLPAPPPSAGTPSQASVYDEARIDARIRRTLRQRRQAPAPGKGKEQKDGRRQERYYDEARIDARIRKTLHARGLGSAGASGGRGDSLPASPAGRKSSDGMP